jgi:hypothetical protein
MKNDEGKNNQPAYDHVTRGEARLHVFFPGVILRPRASIFDRELNGEINVKHNREKQDNAYHPKQHSKVTQVLCVPIYPIRSEKNLQIAEQMTDHEQDQNDACDRDDKFLADGRLIEGERRGHYINLAAAGDGKWYETINRVGGVKITPDLFISRYRLLTGRQSHRRGS